jgi:ferredoxin
LPYEQVSELIRLSDTGSIQACYCRQKARLLKHECKIKAPVENVCMALEGVADFLIRRGFAKAASTDEMLRVLDETEKLGLVHVTDNVRDDPQFICHCCGCCCELLGGINRFGYDSTLNPSRFQAKVIEEKCNGCGVCAKYCHIKALSLVGDNAPQIVVDTSKCLGCGVCISHCAQEALTLTERSIQPKTPKNYLRRHLAITRQKGRLHHSIGYLTGAAISGEFFDFFKSQEQK